jgi:hypothetical protein
LYIFFLLFRSANSSAVKQTISTSHSVDMIMTIFYMKQVCCFFLVQSCSFYVVFFKFFIGFVIELILVLLLIIIIIIIT